MNKAATLKSHGLKATSSQSMLRSMGSTVEADVPIPQKWRHSQIRAPQYILHKGSIKHASSPLYFTLWVINRQPVARLSKGRKRNSVT